MSKNLIVKSNNLVTASYELTANEQRLILSAIAQIPKDESPKDDCIYIIKAEDFIQLGVHPKTAYREINEAIERLFQRVIVIKAGNNIIKTRWVQTISKVDKAWVKRFDLLLEDELVKYDEDWCIFGIKFANEVLPFLTNLTNNFTKYLLEDIANFSSAYSFRLYEFMMQYKLTGFIRISIKELRERLDLNNKYPATKDLKVWVIETAVKEINKKSHYTIRYEFKKTGRKFTHLELKFSLKDKEKKSLKHERDSNIINIFDNLKDKERAIIQTKIDDYIRHKESKGEIINDFHRQNITNKAITEKWGIAEYQQQQAQEQAEKERHAQELAKQQAEVKRQQQKVQKQEMENRAFIEYFESLPQDEQNRIIGKVGNAIAPLFKEYFDEAVANSTAHKDLMYRSFFRQVMDL